MARELIKSDAVIRAIKPGDTRKRLSDGDSLYLLLFVNGGSHGWRFDYTFNGKRKTLSLGAYPDTLLSLARKKAKEARELVAAGVDPSEARRAAKAQEARQEEVAAIIQAGGAVPGTLRAVALQWQKDKLSHEVSEDHAVRTMRRLENHLLPWLGDTPLADITPRILLECLRRIQAKGAIETAHRVKWACGEIFRFGIVEEMCESDPTRDLRDALPSIRVTHRPAILEPTEVGALLRAIDGYKGYPVTRAALQLAPLLFLRPSELRRAEWSEIDLEAATWMVPSARMKGTLKQKAEGQPHFVPLCKQAVAVLKDIRPLTGHRQHVFPGKSDPKKPMSENTVLYALRRMGYEKDEMSGHGFRAMARTLLAERLDVDPNVIEAQLAHAVPDALGRAYNRTKYLEQRRNMMQRWADYLDSLRIGGQVLPFKTA